MSNRQNQVRSEDIRALTRMIRREIRAQGAVVLATEELSEFLGNGRPLDGVRVQQVIRQLADRHGWQSFVFDYGALVRFEPKHPARPAPARSNRSPS